MEEIMFLAKFFPRKQAPGLFQLATELKKIGFFGFFSSQKFGKKSLIPMVYKNLGQIILEMGQKRKNRLFLDQIDCLAQK